MIRHIDFDATIEDEGIIRIPDQWKNGVHSGDSVHVTISPEKKAKSEIRVSATLTRMREHPFHAKSNRDTEKIVLPPGARMTRLVKRMIENPFHVPGFVPLTREEMYDRERDRRDIH